MKRAIVLCVVAAALLTSCTDSVLSPPATPQPSPTSTIPPTNQDCVRATVKIAQGERAVDYFAPHARGCYEGLDDFLDDIGLGLGEALEAGEEITFWTQMPVDSQGMLLPTPTPSPTPTATPIPLVSLSGVVFHDWNLDGTRGRSEPAITGVEICLDGFDSGLCAASDEGGNYYLPNAPIGVHAIAIRADEFPFYYASSNRLIAHQVVSPTLALEADRVHDFGMSQGFLVLPIRCSEMGHVHGVSDYVDVDPGDGIRDWMGGTTTYDGHRGTDFVLDGDVEIVAILTGGVSRVTQVGNGFPYDHDVEVTSRETVPWLDSTSGDSQPAELLLRYVHLQEVSVREGQIVHRGDSIGWMRDARFPLAPQGYADQHLHLEFCWNQRGRWSLIDPFASRWDPENYWTRYNDPACF
jgi:murein DD-endopeptidase MepM/ murein hydrolase activator NlpD